MLKMITVLSFQKTFIKRAFPLKEQRGNSNFHKTPYFEVATLSATNSIESCTQKKKSIEGCCLKKVSR